MFKIIQDFCCLLLTAAYLRSNIFNNYIVAKQIAPSAVYTSHDCSALFCPCLRHSCNRHDIISLLYYTLRIFINTDCIYRISVSPLSPKSEKSSYKKQTQDALCVYYFLYCNKYSKRIQPEKFSPLPLDTRVYKW